MQPDKHPLDNCPRCGAKTIWPEEMPDGQGSLHCSICDWVAVKITGYKQTEDGQLIEVKE